jgi:hypothetical protein
LIEQVPVAQGFSVTILEHATKLRIIGTNDIDEFRLELPARAGVAGAKSAI